MDVYPNECLVDELYLVALQDHDQLFPISDQAYAEELQLQEILCPSFPAVAASSEITVPSSSAAAVGAVASSSSSSEMKPSQESVEESEGDSSGKFCTICMDMKPANEFFTATNCSHFFCVDCISKYVATMIRENISTVKCPDSKCKEMISPSDCREILPKQVSERWDKALLESLMLVSGTTIYCPFKDCSALLLNDEVVVGSAECPSCHRLFCAQCNVAWHDGLVCEEFKWLSVQSEEDEDDVLALRLAKAKEWRRCPNCHFYVDKVSGCTHITCRCSYEFCYGCGSKWSSTHICSNQ